MKKRASTPRTARDIMTRRVDALRGSASLSDAVQTLLRRGYSGAPVVDDDGKLIGVLTEHDCVAALRLAVAESWPEGHVAEHMTRDVATAHAKDDVLSIAQRFVREKHRRLIVVENDRPVGILSRRDLLRALDAMRPAADAHGRSDTYALIEMRHRELD